MVMRHQQNITFVEKKANTLSDKTAPPRRRMCDRGRGHQLSESKNNDDPRRSALAPTSPKWCRGLDGSDMFINMLMKMVPGLGRQHNFDDAEVGDFQDFRNKKSAPPRHRKCDRCRENPFFGSKRRSRLGFARV